MKLIDKDAVLAEIEKRIKNLYPKGGQGMVVTKILKDHYEDLLSFIDSLQEESVSEELGEAASVYQTFHRFATPFKAYIDGAQWQRQKDDEMLTAAYMGGVEKGKMMMHEHMIDKFNEWCNEEFYVHPHDCNVVQYVSDNPLEDIDDFVEEFKKKMEE